MFSKAVKLMGKLGAGALFFTAVPALAAGGLDAGTNAMNDIKFWIYTFAGVVAFVVLVYNIIMALLERKTWGDVGMALVYVAGAGGALLAAQWAYNIFL